MATMDNKLELQYLEVSQIPELKEHISALHRQLAILQVGIEQDFRRIAMATTDDNLKGNMMDIRKLGEEIGSGERDANNVADDLIEMANALEAVHQWLKLPAIGRDRRRYGDHPDSINRVLLYTSEIVARYKESDNEEK
tara:strand:- start:200 stop:616 length:417 start_codon:yes stop_codon:yes gene_type:complete